MTRARFVLYCNALMALMFVLTLIAYVGAAYEVTG